jgi:hypothetical protein
MYRELATVDPQERPPSRLVVALRGQERRSSAVILFHLFTLPRDERAALAGAHPAAERRGRGAGYDHVAHMTATEWVGKIRVFLRKNGWVPLDEAGAKSGD